MRRKHRKKRKNVGIGATTTARSWGFGAVSGKGGRTTNSEIGETMIHREMKEAGKA